MVLIIVAGVVLTGAFAFYISRNVEHGEARFGPDGQIPPYEPPVEEKDWRVTVTQSEKTDD
ncbi:hypothetical protein [Erythrobacter sp. SD-21]|uniref:hypothetical protein n=1 Tax=Erythrobacter sp. SD-21 TaxID=161528 RepID=UPI0018DB6875|nr:hypothetical protein [Erythrobacter sp. SD-21]